MQRVTRVSQAHAVFRVFVVSFDTATKSGLHSCTLRDPRLEKFEPILLAKFE